MYYSRTNGQSDSSKIQCYLILFNVEVSLVTFTVVTAKAKHDRGMDGRTDDGRKILTLVTHNNNNIWHNIFDLDRLCLTKYGSSCQAVYPRSGSRTVTQLSKCMSDVIQMPATAGPNSNRVGMATLCGLLRILLCFELVPPPYLLFFTFVFVLPRPLPFFAGYELPSSIFFFRSENFCRTFGPAHWRFLLDILKNCPIVRQVRRISTALRLFVFDMDSGGIFF